MREEYNFSSGERGKFYHPNLQLDLPIYLDADVMPFLQKVAVQKNIDVQTLVNDWVRCSIALIETTL